MKSDDISYFGTYGRGLSKGIYCANFDQIKGQLSHLENFIKVENSTYLSLSKKAISIALSKIRKRAGWLPGF
ncbi:beta-propeller fold lactonase family protein [Streptococcus catagoni]|uniref:beta-propeller fold lactonase family protein n=1 Tax=Streptococcus catagoni TaxID=2654874 RepID=UPI0039A4B90D